MSISSAGFPLRCLPQGASSLIRNERFLGVIQSFIFHAQLIPGHSAEIASKGARCEGVFGDIGYVPFFYSESLSNDFNRNPFP